MRGVPLDANHASGTISSFLLALNESRDIARACCLEAVFHHRQPYRLTSLHHPSGETFERVSSGSSAANRYQLASSSRAGGFGIDPVGGDGASGPHHDDGLRSIERLRNLRAEAIAGA
jgi:hypothetical protein